MTSSAYQPLSAPGIGAFLSKIDTTKSGAASLAYSTYLHGSGGITRGVAVAVDKADHAYVIGNTYEADFPTTPGAFSTTCPVLFRPRTGPLGTATFIGKIDTAASGLSSLVYSTCLDPVSVAGLAGGIAIDSQGNAYVTGSLIYQYGPTQFFGDATYPLLDPLQVAGTSTFISKLNPAGSALVWSTLFGGGDDNNGIIALGPNGDVFVASNTQRVILGTHYYFDDERPTSADSFSPISHANCQPTNLSCRNGNEVAVARISQRHGAFATINPLNAAFVETEIGSSTGQTLEVALRDMGDKPYTINWIGLYGPDTASFAMTTSCPLGPFGPATSCPVDLTFTPTTKGDHTATLLVDDNAPGGPNQVELSGYGDRFKVSAAKLAFHSTAVGTQLGAGCNAHQPRTQPHDSHT